MFKVNAGSAEEYLRFDPAREDGLRTLDELIRGTAPGLPRWFVRGTPDGQPGMTMTMIGSRPVPVLRQELSRPGHLAHPRPRAVEELHQPVQQRQRRRASLHLRLR
jgi:hypothetical protein